MVEEEQDLLNEVTKTVKEPIVERAGIWNVLRERRVLRQRRHMKSEKDQACNIAGQARPAR